MKLPSPRLLLGSVAALALLGTAPLALADGPHGHGPHGKPAHYEHDRNGYWDGNHQHHPYIVRNGHRGYWWNHVWIIVD
ncbi:hypothetical protein SAMN05444156_3174 [Verrucomicrobium sp. GAS474]|uniref:hypothetical protein n=1 Tax=Verrucomicrobium sp. GAS474 TaxID=1882831 RepID=UPI00087A91BC|nr:hypothetical protein [Verrucomicrobium sp. GAS474]SDU30286.1 hypothetical protein SAMN05444156_3174 [Verrucomicrobium sp. GAS474]